MNCRKARTLLPRYLDGDVSERVGERIEAHLHVCQACSRERELLAGSWDLLGAYETPEVSEGFTLSLMSRIHGEKRQAPEPAYGLLDRVLALNRWRLGAAMATGLAIAISAGILLHELPFGDGSQDLDQSLTVVTDEDLIQNLDVYENLELLHNLDLLSDLEVIENLDEKAL